MANQRRTDRAPLDVYLNKYIGGVPFMARSANISGEGIGVAHLIEPRLHKKRVGLQFQLPGSEEVIYAEGEVVRDWLPKEQNEGSGIRFTVLTDRHRKLIHDYVARGGASLDD